MNEDYDTCQRCGRRLKNPKARQDGFGKVCLKKAMADKEQAEKSEKQEAEQDG